MTVEMILFQRGSGFLVLWVFLGVVFGMYRQKSARQKRPSQKSARQKRPSQKRPFYADISAPVKSAPIQSA